MSTPDNTVPPVPAAPPAAAVTPVVVPPPVPNPYASTPPEPFPYATMPAAPAQGLSIAAMVCGLVGLLGAFAFIGFLPALAGVVLGHLAQKRQPYARGFWLTGMITGYVGVAISLLQGLLLLFLTLLPIALGAAAVLR